MVIPVNRAIVLMRIAFISLTFLFCCYLFRGRDLFSHIFHASVSVFINFVPSLIRRVASNSLGCLLAETHHLLPSQSAGGITRELLVLFFHSFGRATTGLGCAAERRVITANFAGVF